MLKNFILKGRGVIFARIFLVHEEFWMFLKFSGVDEFLGVNFWRNHRRGIARKMSTIFRVTRKICKGGLFGVPRSFWLRKICDIRGQCIKNLGHFLSYSVKKNRRRHFSMFVSTCPPCLL